MSDVYIVKGHWPFPTDMLRYDHSRAADATAQLLIDRLSGEYAPDKEAFQDVEIHLISDGGFRPNTARWESFGWSVPSDKDYYYFQDMRSFAKAKNNLIESALAKLTDEERDVILKEMGR